MTSHDKSFVTVDGSRMAYIDSGEGCPIVFLHGNPTSSYLWRHIISGVSDVGRCLAPDLIGMGDSDKLTPSGPESYSFAEHRHYLDGWFDRLGLTDGVTLVVHDWGSALGFDWARRNPRSVRGIAYMEAIVQPPTWEDLPEMAVDLFRTLRSPAGDDMILQDNLLIEAVLPSGVITPLAPDVLDEYRRPFREAGEGRRPTLTWARQIPIDGDPADVAAIVASYAGWLAASPIPKLFVNADPGLILTGRHRDFCRTWPNQTEATVSGLHFIQEESAEEISDALAAWLRTLPQTESVRGRR